MKCDTCTLEQKVLFFSKVNGLCLKLVHIHLKSLIYFDIL